jgi:hypothetical protein
MQWLKRMYPEQENQVVLPLKPAVLWAPRKARCVWGGGAVEKNLFWPRLNCSSQGRQRRDAVAAGENQHGICTTGQGKHNRLNVNNGKSILAAMYLRRIFVIGCSFAALLITRLRDLRHALWAAVPKCTVHPEALPVFLELKIDPRPLLVTSRCIFIRGLYQCALGLTKRDNPLMYTGLAV